MLAKFQNPAEADQIRKIEKELEEVPRGTTQGTDMLQFASARLRISIQFCWFLFSGGISADRRRLPATSAQEFRRYACQQGAHCRG